MNKQLETFGNYILLEKLATGGMAEVYLAKKMAASGVQKFVAIKRILQQFSDSTDFIKMFKEEAKTSINLSHSNVVSIYDFGIEKSQFYLVMEFVEGCNLRQLLNQLNKKEVRFSLPQVVHIISEAASGLEHAHQCLDPATGTSLNIIHRDISPQNIMIEFQGNIKLVDFGIAKTTQQIEATQAGTIKGKFGYMSPEQAQGQVLDQRTDIFALGIITWELIANQRLFIGNSDINTLKKVLECYIPSLHDINPNVPIELDKIVLKALQKNPDDRYQTADQFQRDLKSFLNRFAPDFSAQDLGLFINELFVEKISELRKKKIEYAQIQNLDDDNTLTLTLETERGTSSLSNIDFQNLEERSTKIKPKTIASDKPKATPQVKSKKQTQIPKASEGKKAKPLQEDPKKGISEKHIEHSQKVHTNSGVYNININPNLSTHNQPKNNSTLIFASLIIVATLILFIIRNPVDTNSLCNSFGFLGLSCSNETPVPRNAVSIDTTPSQSKVFINSKLIGSTPLNFQFKELPVHIQVHKAGYRSIQTSLSTMPQNKQLHFELQMVPTGFIIVNAIGVQIYINNREAKNGEKVPVEANTEFIVKILNPINGATKQEVHSVPVNKTKRIILSLN